MSFCSLSEKLPRAIRGLLSDLFSSTACWLGALGACVVSPVPDAPKEEPPPDHLTHQPGPTCSARPSLSLGISMGC